MKKLVQLLALFFISSSCVEDIDFELNQYVKVLSLDRSSFAEKIIELDNGDLMILGEMGLAAFEQESTGQGSEVNELEDQAPFIAITDRNGNLKTLRMYPIEDILAFSPFGELTLLNVENKTTFHNIIQRQDGGYVVHAQSNGFDYIFNGILIESTPGSILYNDFLLKLNEDLEVESIQTMQGYPNWDGIFRIRGHLKRLGNSELGFLLSQRTINSGSSSGFTFLHLTDNLDTINITDIQASSDFIGQNFAYSEDGQISLLATTQSDFEVFQSPINNININQSTVIAGEGVSNGSNRDENFIEILPDGTFALVYTQPPTGIILEHRASDMSLISGPHKLVGQEPYVPFTVRATRAVHLTQDNQLLIYVLNIPGEVNDGLSGELFKVSLDGTINFRNEIAGIPGDIIETRNQSLITVSNRVYNGSLQKIHITKMNANGELY